MNFSTADNPQSYNDFLEGIPGLAGGGVIGGFAAGGVQALAGDPVGGAFKALGTAIGMIGRGRREANEITPVQSQLDTLLEYVNAEMGNPSLTVERLLQLRQITTEAGNQFRALLNRPWKDGRAAEQAADTMFGNPGYLRVTVENIDKMLASRGASTLTPTVPGQVDSSVLLAGAAALAWAVFG